MGKRQIKILQVAALDITVYFLLLPLMKRLREEGYIVEASCRRGDFFSEIEREGFVVHNIPISRSLNFVKHFASIVRLSILIKKKKFDIVHVHTPIGAFVGRIAAFFVKTPLVIYTIHGFYFHENMNPFKRKIIIFVEKLLALRTTIALSQSQEDTETAIKEKIFPPSRIITIGNGVDINFFSKENVPSDRRLLKKKELGLPENAVVITCVARMVKEKGIFDLIEATKRVISLFPHVHILLVGKISEDCKRGVVCREFIENYFDENPSSKSQLHFLGTRTDVRDILSITDVFVLPSYREGMPRSILEAMAMEIPVIATNIRGCREEVVDRKTGILIPPGDVKALEQAMIELIENKDMRIEFGRNGRKRVEKYFDEDKVVEKEIEVIKKLVNEQTNEKSYFKGYI